VEEDDLDEEKRSKVPSGLNSPCPVSHPETVGVISHFAKFRSELYLEVYQDPVS
jgi:hypothetical protein